MVGKSVRGCTADAVDEQQKAAKLVEWIDTEADVFFRDSLPVRLCRASLDKISNEGGKMPAAVYTGLTSAFQWLEQEDRLLSALNPDFNSKYPRPINSSDFHLLAAECLNAGLVELSIPEKRKAMTIEGTSDSSRRQLR
jgi:hypothetical protein